MSANPTTIELAIVGHDVHAIPRDYVHGFRRDLAYEVAARNRRWDKQRRRWVLPCRFRWLVRTLAERHFDEVVVGAGFGAEPEAGALLPEVKS